MAAAAYHSRGAKVRLGAVALADEISEDPGADAIAERLVAREQRRLVAAVGGVVERLAAVGPVERRTTQILVGGRPLEDARAALDEAAAVFHCAVTLYAGNRCAVAAKGPTGAQVLASGAFAPAVLVDEVLRRGEGFAGVTEHPARAPMVSAAVPLRAAAPAEVVVGIVEVHTPRATCWELAADFARTARSEGGGQGIDERSAADVRKLLDDLSRRLQLLALNGNILAAQAGEHGTAFRLVFRELGSLADRTAQARRMLEDGAPFPKSKKISTG